MIPGKAHAVNALLVLPQTEQTDAVARVLGDLGTNHEAFQIAARVSTTKEYPGPPINQRAE